MNTITLNAGYRGFSPGVFNKFNDASCAIGKISICNIIPYDFAYNSRKAQKDSDSYRMESQIGYESEGFLCMHADGKKYSNIKILKQISKLEKDWNGYGGGAFSKGSISFFNQLIDSLNVQPMISPTGRNSLYMEYNDGKGMLGFEVFEDRIDMAFISDDGETFTRTITDNFCNEINEIVEKYYE